MHDARSPLSPSEIAVLEAKDYVILTDEEREKEGDFVDVRIYHPISIDTGDTK